MCVKDSVSYEEENKKATHLPSGRTVICRNPAPSTRIAGPSALWTLGSNTRLSFARFPL